jgi:ABC-2 type transport system permease protein
LSEAQKYILDQFVMHGGNLLIATDNVGEILIRYKFVRILQPIHYKLNSSDLFFNFGFRINNTIVLDNQCATIPFNISPLGMPPRFEPAPWYYYPLLKPLRNSHHPITHAIDVVKAEFASSLDHIRREWNHTKTILLASSAYSRTIGLPNPVGFSILDNVPDKTFFNTYYYL